jgi:hypothetical protein
LDTSGFFLKFIDHSRILCYRFRTDNILLGCTIMSEKRKYPAEWLEQVPAVVFAALSPGEIRIILHPGEGLAGGGAPRDISLEQIPFELRIPNTPLWVKLDESMNVVRVWRRDE